MARVENLPAQALRSIAAQLAEREPVGGRALSRERPTVIAESLPVYVLETLPLSDSDLAGSARRTPFWHHQLRNGGEAVQFARSLEGQESWTVVEIAVSGIEASLDRAIDLLDEQMPGDEWEARLLVAPAFYVTAVWLHGATADSVMIVSAPPRLDLRRHETYPAGQFLALLAEQGPARGVPLLDDE